MSKVGLIIDGSGVSKPIQLENISYIGAGINNIRVKYDNNATGVNTNFSTYVIQFTNPNPTNITASFIRKRFLEFIQKGLASDTVVYLNDFIPSVNFTSVGQVQTFTTGNIIAAADLTAACAATPNIGVILDKTGNSTPLIGTPIFLIDYTPVAAGTYALEYAGLFYFITVNSVSVISEISICPVQLDYVFNFQNLGAGPVTNTDLDGLSFTLSGFSLSAQDFIDWQNIYSLSFTPTSSQIDPPEFTACNSGNSESIYSTNNAMWPIGVINNGNADFSSIDLAFGIKLADSNFANWSNAEVYVSFDFNANGGVIADSTFVPFVIPTGSPAFSDSPVTGIPGYGNETTTVFTNNTNINTLRSVWGDTIFIPAVGTSLRGSANFTQGSFVFFDKFAGQLGFTFDPNCNP